MTGPHFEFDASLAPAITVALGESILVETQDAPQRQPSPAPEVVYETLDDVMDRIGGANPVTGPIAIEGDTGRGLRGGSHPARLGRPGHRLPGT